ncbi:MAG: winged helix-turn-helix transcriptional regulator [Anaerolineaceae bacterium]|nr:winged helix-turn-helix transcriptional regulator [Anaerolineaceae bacterium]
MRNNQDLARFFKLLSHPTRLDILNVLREGEACVCHINAVLGQRQAYISQQLAALREAGIIQDRKDGWNVYYQITDQKIFQVLDKGNLLLNPSYERNAIIYQPVSCPCPLCSE